MIKTRALLTLLPVGLLVVCLVGLSSRLRAQDAPAPESDPEPAAEEVSYFEHVRPILQQHCHGCHQPAKKEGGLDVTSVAAMQAGGDSEEPLVTAGQPEESLLWMMIVPDGEEPPAMPKEKKPLSEAELTVIANWISAGGADDAPAADGPKFDAEHPPRYAAPPLISALEFSPDGQYLAVSGYHEVLLHRADGSELVARLVGMSQRIESVAFSPDAKRLAVTGGSPARFGEIQIWDVASRELLLSKSLTYDTIYGVSWSHDGTRVAFGCADKTLRAMDAASGEQVLFQGAHSDWVLDTTFANDSSHLVSVSRDRSMKLVEVATERFVDNITSITPGALKGGLIAVDNDPRQDHVVAGGADGVPKIYQMYRTKDRKIGDDYNLIRKLEAMPGRIFDVQFSADGTRIVAASSHDGHGEVRVYNSDDGGLISTFEGQGGGVYACAWLPDGAVVASGGFDGVVRLNNAETGALIESFVPVPGVEAEVAAAP